MSDETWLNAKKAVELGFADVILFEDRPKEDEEPEQPDDPAKEGDEDGKEEEGEKPLKLKETDAVWQYSSRLMGETILNRLGADEGVYGEEPEPKGADQAQEPAKEGLREEDTAEIPPVEDKPPAPVIGMDGKTEDGSMPYEILKDKLEWLR